jgi:hypothetical protein
MRHHLRHLALALLICMAFVYPLLAPAPHRIDEKHYRLIRPGMTEAEVEAIFGVPAGAYDWAVADAISLAILSDLEKKLHLEAEWHARRHPEQRPAQASGRPTVKTWTSRHGVFGFGFDRHGKIAMTGAGAEIRVRIEYPWRRWWRQLAGDD